MALIRPLNPTTIDFDVGFTLDQPHVAIYNNKLYYVGKNGVGAITWRICDTAGNVLQTVTADDILGGGAPDIVGVAVESGHIYVLTNMGSIGRYNANGGVGAVYNIGTGRMGSELIHASFDGGNWVCLDTHGMVWSLPLFSSGATPTLKFSVTMPNQGDKFAKTYYDYIRISDDGIFEYHNVYGYSQGFGKVENGKVLDIYCRESSHIYLLTEKDGKHHLSRFTMGSSVEGIADPGVRNPYPQDIEIPAMTWQPHHIVTDGGNRNVAFVTLNESLAGTGKIAWRVWNLVNGALSGWVTSGSGQPYPKPLEDIVDVFSDGVFMYVMLKTGEFDQFRLTDGYYYSRFTLGRTNYIQSAAAVNGNYFSLESSGDLFQCVLNSATKGRVVSIPQAGGKRTSMFITSMAGPGISITVINHTDGEIYSVNTSTMEYSTEQISDLTGFEDTTLFRINGSHRGSIIGIKPTIADSGDQFTLNETLKVSFVVENLSEGGGTAPATSLRLSSLLPKHLCATQTFEVADNAARDVLAPNPGDECVVLDDGKWYIWIGGETGWLHRPYYGISEVYTKAETMTTDEIANLLTATESGKMYLANDKAARLAIIGANPGDECLQQDEEGWYILYGPDASIEGNWLKRPGGVDSGYEDFRREIDVYSKAEADEAIKSGLQMVVLNAGGGVLTNAMYQALTDGQTYTLPAGSANEEDKMIVRVPYSNNLAPSLKTIEGETFKYGAATETTIEFDAGGAELAIRGNASGWEI